MFDNKVNHDNICKSLWYLPQISLKFEPNLFDICVKSLSYLRRISFIFAPNIFYICTKSLLYLFCGKFLWYFPQIFFLNCAKSVWYLRQISIIFAPNLFSYLRQIPLIFASCSPLQSNVVGDKSERIVSALQPNQYWRQR